MYQIFTTIIISAAVTLASSWGIYSYLPIGVLEKGQETRLGATITNIASSDTLRASRTVINDNFTSLNNGKIENSTTSVAAITTLSNLVTVGTLTSGSLGSGFTAVNVAQGGTGSTTLSLNSVLLGNGTTQLAVVSGLGTVNQVLTSNGAGSAPTWQAISTDEGANFTWTGTHAWTITTATSSFTGTTTVGSLNVTNGLIAGDISRLLMASTTNVDVGGTASTSGLSVVIPANVLYLNGRNGVIRAKLNISSANLQAGTPQNEFYVETRLGGTSLHTAIIQATSTAFDLTLMAGTIEVEIFGSGATNSQEVNTKVTLFGGSIFPSIFATSTTAVGSLDSTAPQNLEVLGRVRQSAQPMIVNNRVVELLR